MISIDTDMFCQMAQSIKSAADETENAASILNQIVTHDNWGCKERVAINEYIVANKNKINELMHWSRSFSDQTLDVAREFVETESNVSDMFQTVEELLREFLSISSAVSSGAASTVFNGSETAGGVLSVVDFSSIAGGFGGGQGGGGFR